MDYKVLVLDIDGTLTNSKKEITSKTKKALRKAYEKGVKVVLASGRPTPGILPIAEEIGFEKVHVFPYSIRKGTRAEKLPGHLDKSFRKFFRTKRFRLFTTPRRKTE